MLSLKSCLTASLMAVLVLPMIPVWAQTTPSESQLTGDWRGDSVCVIRESSCQNEKAVYHVAAVSGKPGLVAITFNKMVNDRMITLGTLECQVDRSKASVACEYSIGVWLLEYKGNKMQGTLTLTDKTLFRRVTLTKDN